MQSQCSGVLIPTSSPPRHPTQFRLTVASRYCRTHASDHALGQMSGAHRADPELKRRSCERQSLTSSARWGERHLGSRVFCTGPCLLGRAGLLSGKRAATHCAYTHLLPKVGATFKNVGRRLRTHAHRTNCDYAKRIQLALEYEPAPPYRCGHPNTAEPSLAIELKADRYEKATARMEQSLRVNLEHGVLRSRTSAYIPFPK